jgi:hypothetical protein
MVKLNLILKPMSYEKLSFHRFPHIKLLKDWLLKLDDEIEKIQLDRNRLLSELCKVRYMTNRLRAKVDNL